MKKIFIVISMILLLVSCGSVSQEDSLKNLGDTDSVIKTDENQDDEFISKLKLFCSEVSSRNAKNCLENENAVISPLSFYMMLGMLALSASGQTKADLTALLGMNLTNIYHTKDYYGQCKLEYFGSTIIENDSKYERAVEGVLKISNSLWLQKNLKVSNPKLSLLINEFHNDAFKVDFQNENDIANEIIASYLKEQFNGQEFFQPNFDSSTLALFVTLLYLQDVWESPLKYSENLYSFNANGKTKESKMLLGHYEQGNEYECDSFRSFYICTKNHFKLTFLVPKPEYTAKEILTKENINTILEHKYLNKNDTKVYTRCIFPKFNVFSSKDVFDLFSDEIQIGELNDFKDLFDSEVQVRQMKQCASIEIDEKGIKGNAITVSQISGSIIPQDYRDFVVNRDFAFIISDCNDVQLFSGLIYEI